MTGVSSDLFTQTLDWLCERYPGRALSVDDANRLLLTLAGIEQTFAALPDAPPPPKSTAEPARADA